VKIIGIILCLAIVVIGLPEAPAQELLTNAQPQVVGVRTNETRALKMSKPLTIQQARIPGKIPLNQFGDYEQKLESEIGGRWFELMDKIDVEHSDKGKGKVVAKFNLCQDGKVTDLTISGFTNSVAAPHCIQAIKECSPFPKWPDGMRSIVGKDYREITYTFYINQNSPKQ